MLFDFTNAKDAYIHMYILQKQQYCGREKFSTRIMARTLFVTYFTFCCLVLHAATFQSFICFLNFFTYILMCFHDNLASFALFGRLGCSQRCSAYTIPNRYTRTCLHLHIHINIYTYTTCYFVSPLALLFHCWRKRNCNTFFTELFR